MNQRTLIVALLLVLCAREPLFADDAGVGLGVFGGKGGSSGGKKLTVKNSISLGVQFGSSYFFPTASYQRMIVRHFALGITGLYSDSTQGNTQSKTYGGFVTANIYSSRAEFTGLWLQGGYGFINYAFKLQDDSEKFSRTGWLLTLGLKSRWYGAIHASVAGGFIGVPKVDSNLINVGLSGTVPVIHVDIGFSF